MTDNLLNIQGVLYKSTDPIKKVDPAHLEELKRTIKRDGLDNVIFQVDNDIYQANGYGLPIKGLVPGSTIDFNYREAKVLAVDKETVGTNEFVKDLGAAVGREFVSVWGAISTYLTSPGPGVAVGKTIDQAKPKPAK